ncbi:MAG: FemAB family PEP-CTERM system-associated protein [Chitinivibrionales bacterium]|nr:FemAB family PEP-CTERM system-associated protein [Chitinivibrionales bacterium]MBD3358610.1 FemAB family PEP-CTERM system-associated protein [Chitinivibrionales bacterium]
MESYDIKEITEAGAWDDYVGKHPHTTPYHQYAFCEAVRKTYHHSLKWLAALARDGTIAGILPLYRVGSFLFGNGWISIPFCDYGGILAQSDDTASLLAAYGTQICNDTGYRYLELRQTVPLRCFDEHNDGNEYHVVRKDAKVRMRLPLPSRAGDLFDGFPSKLRSQIRRPGKEGCTVQSGGLDLLDDFYAVFVRNMRDLGSPVHSKSLMKNWLLLAPKHTRLFVVYKNRLPLAGSFVVGSGDTLVNPWASSDKRFGRIAPNMLLYWGMLEYAIESGYRFFDFGRSSVGEGTYRFKAQWGAQPETLHWYYTYKDSPPPEPENDGERKAKFSAAWRSLPLWGTRILGPFLRRQIPL